MTRPQGEAQSDELLLTASLPAAIDLYWTAQLYIQNLLEDIEGADGRLEYLQSLRYVLLYTLQYVDAGLWPYDKGVEDAHRAAFALEHGVRFLDLDGPALAERVLLVQSPASAKALQTALLELCASALVRLPGKLPAAQGTQGQREILRAIQTWSKAAAHTGDDLGFLADRLGEVVNPTPRSGG